MMRATFFLIAMTLLALMGVLSVGRRVSIEPYYLEYVIQHAISGDSAICRRFYYHQNREVCDYSFQVGLFSAALEGGWRIYASGTDGTGWKFSRSPASGGRPRTIAHIEQSGLLTALALSPDGEWLAIALGDDLGWSHIYRLHVASGHLERLTDGPAIDNQPSWSPDGERIAFNRTDSDGTNQLFTMNADGTHVEEVLPGLAETYRPSWSPDGEWLVFESTCTQDALRSLGRLPCTFVAANLYRLRLADGQIQTVAARIGSEYEASFSPDGEWIVYEYREIGASTQIYRVRPDGTDVQALTSDPDLFHWFPSWIKTPNFAFRPIIMLMIAFVCLIFAWWKKP